jgi:hypothetical protein
MSSAAAMPTQQLNAHPGDELLMRIGIPHRGGRLAFHAFENDYPAMVSASAFWDGRRGRFIIPCILAARTGQGSSILPGAPKPVAQR